MPVKTAAINEVTFTKVGNELRLSNGVVELTLDAHNGYFTHIRDLAAGIEHKPPTDGVWPFGVWLGSRQEPKQRVAEIRAGSPQRMNYHFADGILDLVYPAMVDNATRQSIGVRLTVHISMQKLRDYFVITAKLQNQGRLPITNFYAARGMQLTGDGSRDHEKFTTAFRGPTSRLDLKAFSRGSPVYTATGWYDYQGRRGSIGMGYLNHQGMMMIFDVAPQGAGVQQSWRMFNLKGYFHFEKMFPPDRQNQLYPLESGGEFTTDEWIIAPHQGDWHRMADIYRERYNEVFKEDYIDYAHSPQIAKDVHLVLATWLVTYKVYMQPREFLEKVRTSLSRLNVDPKQVGVSIHQGGRTWASPMAPGSLSTPDFFPLAPEIGGTEAVKQAIVQLKQLGIRFVGGYTYVQGNYRGAQNYVPEADASEWVPDINPPAGRAPCIYNSAWQALWRDRIAPRYRELGDNSVYFDTGPQLWGICEGTGPTHLHGSKMVGVLTGSSRGGVQLSRIIRERLGPDATTMTEGFGDVSSRWVDIWTAFSEPTIKYTWPDKIYFWRPATVQGLNDSLIYGYVPHVNFAMPDSVTKALDSSDGDPQILASIRRFLDVREELTNAPGYPDGFRDDVGLTSSDGNLVAKVFRRPGAGVTVVYYAKAPVQAELSVDGAKLENPQLGSRHQEVRLKKDESGYWIVSK